MARDIVISHVGKQLGSYLFVWFRPEVIHAGRLIKFTKNKLTEILRCERTFFSDEPLVHFFLITGSGNLLKQAMIKIYQVHSQVAPSPIVWGAMSAKSIADLYFLLEDSP